MTTISELREQLSKPSVQKNKKLFIGLARKGLKITTAGERGHGRSRSLNEWFLFRFLLAKGLLKRETGTDINTVIRLMASIRRRINPREHPRMWADTCLVMATAYERKQTGDRNENIARAIAESEAAFHYYNRESHPEVWALAKYQLGNIYSLYESKDRPGKIDEAIKNYRGALTVLANKNADLHKDILDAIKELERERKAIELSNGEK